MPAANCAVIEDIRGLSAGDINKLTNAQLKLAIATLLGNDRPLAEPSNADLMNELQAIKEELQGIQNLRLQVEELREENRTIKEDLRQVFEILHHQQLFTESVERRERQKVLIITGISEDADTLGRDDQTKIRNVLQKAGCTVDVSGCDVQRLGQPDPERRRRPIKVTLTSPRDRDTIVASGKSLKDKGDTYKKRFLKKDTHPIVRKEINRLKKREFEEKRSPANEQVTIEYDWQNRVLRRDGVIIDRFMPRFF